jgi:hypothetical protein
MAKRRNEKERAEMVRQWRNSGEPAEPWCKGQQVTASSLYRWIAEEKSPLIGRAHRGALSASRAVSLAFEQLQPGPDICEETCATKRSIVLDLMLAGGPARIRIDAGTDAAALGAILSALSTVTGAVL